MEKRISEWFGRPVKINEQRNLISDNDINQYEEYVLFSVWKVEYQYVVNSTTLSCFTIRSIYGKGFYDEDEYKKLVDIAFEECKKLSNFEKIIKYNFDVKQDYEIDIDHIHDDMIVTPYIRAKLIINSQYLIERRCATLIVRVYDLPINEYTIKYMTIYDILDHPLLQQFRINHSKLINQTIFE